MAETVFMVDVASMLGMDRAHARRYVISLGYRWLKVRAPNGQLSNALTREEAEAIVDYRRRDGFSLAQQERQLPETWGEFYIVRLIPELAPNRIKVGFSVSACGRLAAHRTSAPTAEIVRTWPCKRTWELCIIDAAICFGCQQVGLEVYDCEDVEAVVGRCDRIFGSLPRP